MGHIVTCFKVRYHALPRIIGCADMPRGAAMPRLPRLPLLVYLYSVKLKIANQCKSLFNSKRGLECTKHTLKERSDSGALGRAPYLTQQ